LPIGLLQAQAALDHGLWYARSAEFMHAPLMQTLKWFRVPGDTIFAVGALSLAWFVVGLRGGWSLAAPQRRRKTAEIPGGHPARS